jgi:hypothetical protein
LPEYFYMKTFCRRVLVRLSLLGLAIVLTGAVATAKPTVSIANLKAGQSFTNAAFTVSGAAASSAGISNVLFSLNQGAWSGTTSSNQWTNWTAAVTWIPGTNTFSVAAVDNSGSFSTTNTVKVFYSVITALTVVINGNGSVSPNYNGQPLVIGKGYSMKAAAGKGTQKGYGFRNWTDGNNNVLTTAATVKFLMASNLTFAANFGYTGKPTISVTSTTTNSDGYPADFVIHGTTSGTVAVTNVYYQLNGSLWTNASSSNHWANWTANVRLAPGGNTFNAYALNASNNPSTLGRTIRRCDRCEQYAALHGRPRQKHFQPGFAGHQQPQRRGHLHLHPERRRRHLAVPVYRPAQRRQQGRELRHGVFYAQPGVGRHHQLHPNELRLYAVQRRLQLRPRQRVRPAGLVHRQPGWRQRHAVSEDDLYRD